MALFRPREILQDFALLDIKKYKDLGFEAILVDVDNTLAIPDTELVASDKAKNFVNILKENGFKVIVVSNNTKQRVEPFANSLDCDYYYWCFKPLPFAYLKILKEKHLKRKTTITLGDQLITDCLGANIIGLYPIYVKQLVEKDTRKTIINRYIERLIFKYILHEKV